MTHTKTILKSQLPTVMSTPNDAAVLIQRVAQQQVRVISEPDPGVLGELLERVNLRAGPLARDPFPLEVVPDRLAVAPEMPGDRTDRPAPVSYTHLRAHETDSYLVCRLLLEKKKQKKH